MVVLIAGKEEGGRKERGVATVVSIDRDDFARYCVLYYGLLDAPITRERRKEGEGGEGGGAPASIITPHHIERTHRYQRERTAANEKGGKKKRGGEEQAEYPFIISVIDINSSFKIIFSQKKEKRKGSPRNNLRSTSTL